MTELAEQQWNEITVLSKWDGRVLRTAAFEPEGSVRVLLGFTVAPQPGEAGLPPIVAVPLARALTRLGVVAGRLLDKKDMPAGTITRRPRHKGVLAHVAERVTGAKPDTVVVTQDIAVVSELLDQGWWVQQQALLVLQAFDAGSDACERAVDTLSRVHDWRHFSFSPPVQALIAPGVDGDYILFATKDAEAMASLMAHTVREFEQAGFRFGFR